MSSSNSLEREISEHTELLDENSSNTSSKETYNATNDLRVAVTTYASSFKFINYVKKRSYEEIVCSSNDTVVDFGKFGISKEALNKLIEDKDRARLEDLGGVDGIARALRSDFLNGIHDVEEDIALRREVFCVNTPENPPRKTFLQFFWRALLKFKILILIICGSVSLGLGIKVDGLKKGSKEGASIMVGVFVAVIFIAISDYWHGKVFQKLREDGYKINIEVVRGGSRQKIAVADIVVGDVVRLSYGDKVPANGLLIEQPSLKLEGCRTNCSKEDKGDPVELDVINNDIFMFSGTKVVDGSAWMLVTSVGMNARRKQKENIIHHKSTETPSLEAGLEGLDSATDWIGYILTIVGFIFAVSGGLSFTTTDENGLEKQATGMAQANQIVGIVVTLITSAVNITDPLRLTLTLTRAFAMKKLKARNVMVRKLSALETMSFVDTICINKTTINQMKVTEFLLGNDFMVQDMYSSITLEVRRLLQEGIALNILSISPIEKAINSWALENLEMDRENIKTNFNINQIEAFTPEKKENWILAKRKADNKTIQVHLNGAAQLILQVCSWYYDASGNVNKIDHDLKLKLEQNIRSMAAKKLKCIAFAHKEVQDDAKANVLKDDMILLGIVGIEDRCRPQLKNEVKDLHNAGVKLIMITGDNICSAKDIAEQCGILEHHSGEVVEAAQFRNFTLEERKEKVNKICVMANSSPEDKRLMVECLKGNGNVVGVVVHGTNDSSAMKEAHIGIYMGKEGTAIIEEHSNIVISDGNFPSIIMILKWGRCVYCNIQKFIQFQLIVSSAALLSNNVGLVLLQKVTLSTTQLLWVGLITDTLACLAFANERPTKELIKKPPVHTEDPLVTNIMLRNILPQALFQTIVLFHMPESNGDDYQVGVTFIFNLYVFCQVFNQINARKLETKNVFEKILANKFFLGTAVFIIVLQILLVEILKLIADTTKLNWLQWSSCIGIAFSTLPIGLIVRYIPVPKTQVMSYRLVGRIIERFRLKK